MRGREAGGAATTGAVLSAGPVGERRVAESVSARGSVIARGLEVVPGVASPVEFPRGIQVLAGESCRRETLACSCGDYIVNAPGPERTTANTQYGPGFVAHLIVSK